MIYAHRTAQKTFLRPLSQPPHRRRTGAVVVPFLAVVLASPLAPADERPAYRASLRAAAAPLFAKYADVIERISFWNLHDGQSWLNYFPWTRVNYPLLFDRQRKPKPAFDAVMDVLNKTRVTP